MLSLQESRVLHPAPSRVLIQQGIHCWTEAAGRFNGLRVPSPYYDYH